MATTSTRTTQESLPADLGRRLQEGDERVLEDILLLLGPRIVRGLRDRYPLLRDGECDEVLVEAVARLWDARLDFDPAKGDLAGYLFTIAVNCARDILRSNMQRPRAGARARAGRLRLARPRRGR